SGVSANALELVTYALAGGAASLNWNTPAGAPTMTQVFQAQSPNATAANRVVGIQSTWLLDSTVPTAVTLTAPPATVRGTITLTGSATENDSSLDLVFQRSPAGANTWTTI